MPIPIVTVLRCDVVPEPDITRHGDTHERMVRHLTLAADLAGLQLELRVVDAFNGEQPADDDHSALYVTTGSATDPDSTEPWVLTFNSWIAAAYARGTPIYGICFGHQVLARVLGGSTDKHPGGWELGVVGMERRFHLPAGGGRGDGARDGSTLLKARNPGSKDERATDSIEDHTDEVRLVMSHQDRVYRRPDAAIPWMVGTFCAEQGYVIPGRAVTLQGHPEFEAEQAADLYRRRRQRLGGTATDAAVETMQSRNDGVAVTAEVLRYFLG